MCTHFATKGVYIDFNYTNYQRQHPSYVKIQVGSRPLQNVNASVDVSAGCEHSFRKRKLAERGLSSVFFLATTKKKVFMMNVFSLQCWMAMSKLRAEHQYRDNMKNNINR